MTENPLSSLTDTDEDYQRLLAEVWQRNERTILAWVSSLQAAATLLNQAGLGPLEAEQAEREAHKLRGCLGNFGLFEASRMAQEIESIFASPDWNKPHSRQQIAKLAESLERNIRSSRQET
jgi:HPt (histidine-containing phosphotransfer) domain-containing protein